MAQKAVNGGKRPHAKGSEPPFAAHQHAAHKEAANQHGAHEAANQHAHKEWFSRFAQETARLAGKPVAFIAAVAVVAIWAATGPLFHYSDTWQLVINTSTTIITFLMVFLIQHTQNRDTMALQVKLAELIIAVRGAHNRLATAEDLTEEELEQLHKEYCSKADATRETLDELRAKSRR
jgi:low affinity Fe/Cu permease